MSGDSGDDFQFSGWLRFNGLYFTETIGEVNPSNLFDENDFQLYEGGNPGDPDEGYKRTRIADLLSEIPDLDGGLSNLASNLYTYKYVTENWVPRPTVDSQGETHDESFEPKHKTIDIFWDFDDVMVFRGRKSTIEDKRKDLRGGLSGGLKIEEVHFHFDFLLWILYQSYQGNDLRSDLSLQSISDCRTVGNSRTGTEDSEVTIGGESEIVRSVPFITAILEGNKIDNLEGDFFLGSQYIVAEIDSDGWIHVKASREDLDDLNNIRQMGVAVRFVTEFLRLYEEWVKLDRVDQYPPQSFLEELVDLCDDEGYVLKRTPNDLYDEYEQKREGVIPGPSDDYTLSKFS
jgi:hypothetical protein